MWLILGLGNVLLKLIGQANILGELRPDTLCLIGKLTGLLDAIPDSSAGRQNGDWIYDLPLDLECYRQQANDNGGSRPH